MGALGPHAPSLTERLQIPAELPGTNVPPLWLPPLDQPERRLQAIDTLFPDLPPMPRLALPTDPRQLYSLTDLEQMAIANNPLIAQAEASITVAMGQAIQAGVYPNPIIGYEADTVGSAGTRNYQGVFGTQVIKTANKLGLARSVANVNVTNAQLAYRRARIDLMAQVKSAYFAVLVAQESVMINEALVRFTGEVYQIQDDKLKGGVITPYEPAQLRSLAVQARTALVQAQMNYVAAWKSLAVVLGMPGIPLARLEGSAEMPVPKLSYEAALARMLNVHPDLQAARFTQGQARIQQRLERVTPIPDINVYGTFQRDFTTPNVPRTTYNVQFGVPLPLWDRNRGNILSAQGNIIRTTEDIRRVEYDLTAQLVDAFTRFETSRIFLQYNREQILPDLTRAYRGVYIRYQQEGETARGKAGAVGFGDIIVAQQNLTGGLAAYVILLNNQWTAVADLARLLQVESISELNLGLGDAPAGANPSEQAPR
jgi:cobalt-zinc-cadmium efflux system outer membrane protein